MISIGKSAFRNSSLSQAYLDLASYLETIGDYAF